jgi:hypothetical protein
MANKPTKAEYEGFKKALANPMTPQPIKDKLQSVIDQYASEYEGSTETKERKPRATKAPAKKATGKKSVDDIEKAKAEIKRKTGKTEEECESIIEQYRALRTKAQEGKRKAEQASAENKKRVEKLDKKGDLIEGTTEKTADAVIETATEDVAEKIEKQIEAVEEKAEKEAKAEVAKDKTLKTPKAKKEAVEAKVEKKVAEKTKTIVKRVVIDTSALLISISESLGKFDKDSQKEFLIKLRSDIDKMLSKFAFGGMTDGATQVMNIQQSNLSASSVNPTLFAGGGGVDSYGKGGRMFGEDARLEYVDDAFASEDLKDELREKLGIEGNSLGDNVVISFAYTDYGGDFLDKVAIRYFEENYPENIVVENAGYNGQNAYVFGEPAQEWIDTTDDYPLGFENIEDLYYEMQNEAEYESYEYFLDDLKRDDYVFDKDEVMDWLMENKGGYYSMTTQGLDFSYSDLTDELVNEGLIKKEEEEYKTGGSIKDVIVYDNGGESFDRYTIFTPDGSVFGMSENATMPNGFNMYIGEDTEIKKGSHLGKRLKSVPQSIEKAVMNRLNETYAKGGFVSKGERVWNKMRGSERYDFLYKNFTPKIPPRTQETLKDKNYRFLPKDVKIAFEAEYANKEYAKGGGVGSMLRNRRGQ